MTNGQLVSHINHIFTCIGHFHLSVKFMDVREVKRRNVCCDSDSGSLAVFVLVKHAQIYATLISESRSLRREMSNAAAHGYNFFNTIKVGLAVRKNLYYLGIYKFVKISTWILFSCYELYWSSFPHFINLL